MKTKTIADVTIHQGEPEMFAFEDGRIRIPHKAHLADGTWIATYWHPPLPPRPGLPSGNWQTVEEFEAWIAWARS